MKSFSVKKFLYTLLSNPRVQVIFLILCGALALSALIFPIATRPPIFELKIGDVSPEDIQAPRSLEYESTVLTEKVRSEAEKSILPIYLPADPAIARRNLEHLRITLAYINSVRMDAYASTTQKTNDLRSAQYINISPSLSEQLLTLDETRWEIVQKESLNVLEQIMRSTIREDRVEEVKRTIPTLISFSLTEDLAALVNEITAAFVTPNSLYSPEQTEQARLAARESIKPIINRYIAGETIVRRGQVINETAWEALQQFGIIQHQDRAREISAAIALTAAITSFIGLYFTRRKPAILTNPRSLFVISILFFIFLYGAKLATPNRLVLPYIFPIAAFALTISSLYNLEIGLIFSIALSVLAGYGMIYSLDLTIYYLFTSLCGALIIEKGRHLSSFFWSGLGIALTGTAIIFSYRLPDAITDWIGLATLAGAALVNGLAAASLTLLFHFIFSQLLGITTAMQLLELSRPDHPLLKLILQNAPGTYQHSLQVANLAEQAAEAIGADALLTRIGALYHDAGKSQNTLFFIENQPPGNINAHDEIPPETSAATIIQHVTDGVRLGKKYRLPPRILDFMREHHGTMLTRYQYTRAVQAAGSADLVDANLFRYPGPRPQSKETAILMLADGAEARARAELPKDEEELRSLVKKVVEYCQKEDQLADTNLTQRDIQRIIESFVNTLRNTYHPRIQYPELKPSSPESKPND